MLTFLYLLICFMLPNIAWQLLNRKRLMRRKNPICHIVLTCIFWGYCALTIHVTGIGTIWDIISFKEITGGFNLIPFSSEGIKTYILNVLMLMPLGFRFLQEVSAAVEAGPLCLAIGSGLADTGADIAYIRSILRVVVPGSDGNGAGGVTVQGELGTCQILIACGIGLGRADGAVALAIGSPVAAEVVKGVGTILRGGVHLRLNAVDKTGSEQLIGTALFPDGRVMVGAVFAAQHQLTDHGIRGLFHPGAGFKALVAVGTGSVGGFQPILVGAGRRLHITDGVDAVGTAQVLGGNIRPNDGGDQGVAILRNTELNFTYKCDA